MRRRSSSRCCSRLIAPSCRVSRSLSLFCSGSATRSGIVILRDAALNAIGKSIQRAGQGGVVRVIQNLVGFADRRFQMLTGIRVLKVKFADFVLNLALEAVT